MKDFKNFRGRLERNYPLALKNTWRIGGYAEIYAEPEDYEDLLCLLETINRLNIPLYILGRGSNILIDDGGVPGITLFLGNAFTYMWEKEGLLHAGSSTAMPALSRHAGKLGFVGFEFLIGIPGTVGAGVVINAGKGCADGMDMKRILQSVIYITKDLQVETKNVEDLHLLYRSSAIKNTSNIVIEAVFKLKEELSPSEIYLRQRNILVERRKKFPLQLPNAGSVFKRPSGSPPAGYLIDTAGLKGYKIGGAQVSEVHANFIVNDGNATSKDVKNLMNEVVEKVKQAHGVELEKEVVFWPEQMNWCIR